MKKSSFRLLTGLLFIGLILGLIALSQVAKSDERYNDYKALCDFKRKNAILDCEKYHQIYRWTKKQRDDCYLDAHKLKELCMDAYRYDRKPPYQFWD